VKSKTEPSQAIVNFRVTTVTIEDTRALDLEAFALFMMLLVVNGHRDFHLSTEMRHLMPQGGWSERRFTKAVTRLIRGGYIAAFKVEAPVTILDTHTTVQ
jgi:hypothetical protein